MRLIMTVEVARRSAIFCSAASALAAFLAESFSARFWASTERLAVEAASASVVWGRLCQYKFIQTYICACIDEEQSVPGDHIVS